MVTSASLSVHGAEGLHHRGWAGRFGCHSPYERSGGGKRSYLHGQFFSSVPLYRNLLADNSYFTGTLRTD